MAGPTSPAEVAVDLRLLNVKIDESITLVDQFVDERTLLYHVDAERLALISSLRRAKSSIHSFLGIVNGIIFANQQKTKSP